MDKLKKKDRYVIIMAGGRGERFWPVSRERTPKQLIRLLGSESFLQATVSRLRGAVPPANIFVITNRVQAPAVARQLPALPRENIIAEPCGRDTCAAVALGAALVGGKSTSGVMAVLPADHVIPNRQAFQRVLLDCLDVAANEASMVTIGIPPTEPATGYGYIHAGKQRSDLDTATTFYAAKRFVEKPNLTKAKQYLKSGQYRWNAGMFIWSYATIWEGLERHAPEIASVAAGWRSAGLGRALTRRLASDYPGLTKISIDFALMEKAKNVVVADGAFDWDDLGAWTALARHVPLDDSGNALIGDCVSVDSANNIVFDGRTGKRGPVTLVGVSDSIVVLTNDATLIAAQSQSQKIKDLVKVLGQDPRWKGLV